MWDNVNAEVAEQHAIDHEVWQVAAQEGGHVPICRLCGRDFLVISGRTGYCGECDEALFCSTEEDREADPDVASHYARYMRLRG